MFFGVVIMSANNPIYAFSFETFLKSLNDWELEQVEAFPHRKTEIHTVYLAMQDFMLSENIKNHKMLVSGTLENIELKYPGDN
jgi:hypothetical protein